MKELVLEALDYYRNIEHLNGEILFHVRNNYEAYQNSAEIISVVCDLIILEEEGLSIVRFPESILESILLQLHNRNFVYHLIEYRNEFGCFDIPKVKQILEDADMDY